MKARVKTLGLIVEVTFSHAIHDNGHDIIWYKTPQGDSFTKDELEFITTEDNFDYWTRLKHQYAGMAMQGILSNQDYCKLFLGGNRAGSFAEDISRCASDFAHALVEKYKKEERK